MGVVPERQEVLKVVGLRLQDLGALRLELPEPVECPLVAVQPSVRMEPGVGDNADARAAGTERNEPDPVAAPHQMVGAQPPSAAGDPCPPPGILAPVVDTHA